MLDKPSKKLEALKKKQAQLKSQIDAMEAAEKSRERKRDTRRKILIGAYYFDKAKREESFESLVAQLDGYLKRDTDRALFGLSPVKAKEDEVADVGAE